MAVDVEAAAGTLYRFVVRLLVLVFRLSLLTAGSLKVEMAGETQTVFLNHNATISCKILDSSHLDIKNMGVTWFWKNPQNGTDDIVFQFYANQRNAFRSGANVCLQGLEKGDASLQLPKVQLLEAGEYRCQVVNTPDGGQGTVFLQVVAYPAISLSMEKAKGKDNDDQLFLCEATGFYPKSINITWCKWSQENSQCLNISENFTTNAAIENKDKTFNVTSALRPEHNVTYQCMVEHTSLHFPWRGNITLPENGSETKSDSRNLLWIIFLFLAALVSIIVAIFLWKKRNCSRNCSRGSGGPNHPPELSPCPLLCNFAVPSSPALPLDTGLNLVTCSDQWKETSEGGRVYFRLLSFVLLTSVRGGHVQAVLPEDGRQRQLEWAAPEEASLQ